MSLDLYLYSPQEKNDLCVCRECNNEHIDKYYPLLFHTNITHNLWKMADECGIYHLLWRQPENDFKKASQIIPDLEKGLLELRSNPEKYKEFNSKNGWGVYENFVGFVSEYLEACKLYPDSNLSSSR